MILQTERAWGKHPGWFDTLDPAHQERVLALAFAEASLSEEEEEAPPPPKVGRRG